MPSENLKWRLRRACNFHSQGSLPNIFLLSTARSGSSWLMEILATQRGMKFVNEPLLIEKLQMGDSPIPARWDFLLPNPERQPLLERYFNDLTHNRIATGSPGLRSRFHRWVTWRIVFKVLRCKDLANWFEERFGVQIIYLLRHPLATNISRAEYKLLPLYLDNEEYCRTYLTSRQVALCKDVIENGSELQKKVLDWALQNLPPIKFLDRSKWLCVHYEDLVTQPETQIDRLAAFLKLENRDEMIRQHRRPSESVSLSDKGTREFLEGRDSAKDSGFLLDKWRRKLSAEDEERAFELLDAFDIDLYSIGVDHPIKRLE